MNGGTRTTLRARFYVLRRRLQLARKLNTQNPFGWAEAWRQAGNIQKWSAVIVLEERAERAEFERSVLADLAALPCVEVAA